jgi:ABC-type bacteriocin/lantibiotic exporter with double-glycine peptidase domain
MPAYAGAAFDPFANSCAPPADQTAVCKDRGTNKFSAVVKTIVNSLLYILAAVSVVVIIIAGITYTTSGGDSAMVTKAKNTLLYAVVGLVVAILAYAIVNYVINAFGG